MATEQELNLRFKVNDDGSVVLDKIGKSIQNVDQQTQTMSKSLALIKWDSITNLGQKAIQVAEQVFHLAEAGAKVKSLEDSFAIMARNVGINSESLISNLKKATNATIDNTELMGKATRMVGEGFSPEQVVQIGAAARVAARMMGIDVSEAYERISDSVINLRQRGLKTAGFIIDLNQAYDKQAKLLGINATVLSDYGKTQAVINAVNEKTAELEKKLGMEIETSSERIQKQKAAWIGVKGEIQKATSTLWDYITAMVTYTIHQREMPEWVKEKTGYRETAQAKFFSEEEHGGIARIGVESEEDRKKRMVDGEKLIELELKRGKAIFNSSMEYAKLTGDIYTQVGIAAALGENEKQRLSKEAILTDSLRDSIDKVNEAKARELIIADKLAKLAKEQTMLYGAGTAEAEAQGAKFVPGEYVSPTAEAEAETRKKMATGAFQTPEGWINMQDYIKNIDQVIGAEERAGEAAIHVGELRESSSKAIDDARLALIDYRKQLAELQGNTSVQISLDKQWVDEMIRQGKILPELAEDFKKLAGARQAQMSATVGFLQDFGRETASIWATSLTGILDRTSTFSEGMKKMFTNLGDFVISKLLQMGATQALFGNLAGKYVSGSGIIGTIGGWLGLQEGGQFWVNRPTPLLVGEGGQREFVSVTPESRMGKGGGGDTYIIQNYNQVNDPNTFVKLYGPVVKKLSEQSSIEAKRLNKMR
jgi:hypothetical protein